MTYSPFLPPGGPSRKRSAPADPMAFGGRPLAPKQPSTMPVDTGRSLTGHHPNSPLVDLAPSLTEPRKKRGRPTKKEQEERRKQHAERTAGASGLQLQPQPSQGPQSPLVTSPYAQPPPPALPPSGDVPPEGFGSGPPRLATMSTPLAVQPDIEHNSSSSSGKKKRGRPPKLSDPSDLEPMQQPSFTSSASAYGSPPQSASVRARRASVSTRSQGLTPGPSQAEPGTQAGATEEARPQNRQRTWNDTVMGTSNPHPRPT
jgi:hypothetical protein